MKFRRAPKPVILEPSHASLYRLGREMGRGDVPAAELVRDSILSTEASRAVDRAFGDRESAEGDRAEDDMQRGLLFSKHCYGCGMRCTQFGTGHAPGCDIDRSLTAQQRYKLRHPEGVDGAAARWFRGLRLRSRWAIIKGRCGRCTDAPIVPGRKMCRPCLDAERDRNREARARTPAAEQREAA